MKITATHVLTKSQRAVRGAKLRLHHSSFLAADKSACFGRSDILRIPPLPREISRDRVFASHAQSVWKCNHGKIALIQRDQTSGAYISCLWLDTKCGLCNPETESK